MIGSANLDRRSFDLDFGNNILFYDPTLTADVRRRQQDFIERPQHVTVEDVAAWPVRRRP